MTNTIEIFCTVEHETDGSYLVDDGTDLHWIPKSQISEEEEDGKGNVTLTIPEWLALEKGLI